MLLITGQLACIRNKAPKTLDVEHWGTQGDGPGQFTKPRGIATGNNELYVVDKSGRLQVFDLHGQFLRQWQLPDQDHGTPTTLLIDRDGNVIIPDTHNSRILAYTSQGEHLWTMGSYGAGPGQFCFITAVVQDTEGKWFVAEYGNTDRIQIFSPEREYLTEFGEYGAGPGQFSRIMGMTLTPDGVLYIADSVNNRIQALRLNGTYLYEFGGMGKTPGKLTYPYDITYSSSDDTLYVCEYGSHRIQHFKRDGTPIGVWGKVGNGNDGLWNPWGVTALPDDRVAVADCDNFRITVIGNDGWLIPSEPSPPGYFQTPAPQP